MNHANAIVEKAKGIAYQLFPEAYQESKKSYHFAFLFRKNKLLAIGQNQPNVESYTAFKFAKRFGTETKFNYKHAEISCISRLWGRQIINSDMKMVVLRVNSWGTLQNSKPCKNCQIILDALDVRKVYYSNKDGEIECST